MIFDKIKGGLSFVTPFRSSARDWYPKESVK